MLGMLLSSGAPVSFDWGNFLQTGGVIAMFLALSWALLKKWIVPGWVYEAMVKERDYYRDMAYKGAELAERQTDIAERLTDSLMSQRRLQAQTDLADFRRRDDDDPRR